MNYLNFFKIKLGILMIKLKIIEIASLLNISERKAYQYKKSMMNKLNIECELDLLKFFFYKQTIIIELLNYLDKNKNIKLINSNT